MTPESDREPVPGWPAVKALLLIIATAAGTIALAAAGAAQWWLHPPDASGARLDGCA